MAETFPSFPPCCQKVLAELIEQQKSGSRNCEKGHAVNLANARRLEAEARKKKEEGEAKADAGAKAVDKGASSAA